MQFGKTIKAKRELLGMTQQDLAEKLFVSRQTVCRWENGTRCPDLIMAKKIALVLGISVDDLIPGDAVQEYVPVKEREADLSFFEGDAVRHHAAADRHIPLYGGYREYGCFRILLYYRHHCVSRGIVYSHAKGRCHRG